MLLSLTLGVHLPLRYSLAFILLLQIDQLHQVINTCHHAQDACLLAGNLLCCLQQSC